MVVGGGVVATGMNPNPKPSEDEDDEGCRWCKSGDAGLVMCPASPSSLSASKTNPRSSRAWMTLGLMLRGTRMKSE